MKLSKIRELVEAATPGNWRWMFSGKSDTGSDMFLMFNKETRDPSHTWVLDAGSDGNDCGVYVRKEDAALIAASRTLMPKLLKVAEAAKAFGTPISRVMGDGRCACDDSGQCSYCRTLEEALHAATAALEADE